MVECVGQYCSYLVLLVYFIFVYEIIMVFIIGVILWFLWKKVIFWLGLFFVIYFIFNGIECYFIEGIWVNDCYEVFGGFMQVEFIVVILIFIGLSWIVWLLFFKKKIVMEN